jgi:hypothetical protein
MSNQSVMVNITYLVDANLNDWMDSNTRTRFDIYVIELWINKLDDLVDIIGSRNNGLDKMNTEKVL